MTEGEGREEGERRWVKAMCHSTGINTCNDGGLSVQSPAYISGYITDTQPTTYMYMCNV